MTFGSTREIMVAIEESLKLSHNNRDRHYSVKVSQDNISGSYNVTINYLTSITYDKEQDMQISREPITTDENVHLIFPRDITAREILDKIEDIEFKELKIN